MVAYLLDSSFLIDHLRGFPPATERFNALNEVGDTLMICDITAAEVWSGRASEHARIERLLRYLEFVQPGPPTSMRAGIWRAEARDRGRTLDIPDALIAATAYDLKATLLTRNVRDFELTSVRIETY
jgi:tRNA(fMet)-specific endonuclease VapC